uniref:Putative DNA binding, helix-turn-helix domain containing protein n=1 Tax=viral metagenome TaxID=1070528 RepID=A0A6M3KTE2_9ZZZZ
MLTVKEIAEKLQVHEQTVYRWINRGELKAQRVGGLLRITEEAYQEFINKG